MPNLDALDRNAISVSFAIGFPRQTVIAESGLFRPRCALMPFARLFSDSCRAMGTLFQIHLYADDANQAALCYEIAFNEIRRIDRTLSHYQETSELTRINQSAVRQAVTTDPEVFRFLQLGFDYSRQSGGAFDMTIGPLMHLWGFFDGEMRVPSEYERTRSLVDVGWNKIILDSTSRSVEFLSPGMELDPGALGKGYAVDSVASLLREQGIRAALIDAGSSSVYGLGAPPGKSGWLVRVPHPGNRSDYLSTVTLCDRSLSTSGSYEKFFRWRGRTYCHILDPRTGHPVEGMLQTTVVSSRATDSEAISTIAFVSGPKAGIEFLRNFGAVSALWVPYEVTTTGSVASSIRTWNWPETVLDPQTMTHRRSSEILQDENVPLMKGSL